MDIAVSCCYGSSGYRDGCLYAASYEEAKSHCEDNGYRLCTMDEMLSGLTAQTGCGFDCPYSWVSDSCTLDPTFDPTQPTQHPTTGPTKQPTVDPTSDPTKEPTDIPTMAPTSNPTMASHYIAAGRPGLSLWNDFPTSECTNGDSTQASVATDLNNVCRISNGGNGTDIAVSCCSLDGTSGERDASPLYCLQPASFEEAKSHCEENGYRLCTKDEMLSGLTASTGCGFDCRYSWVSDSCVSGWEATSTETFDGVDMEIGWIQYSHCEEGENANIYNPDYTMDELIERAETAITVKIMPSGEIPGQSETT